MISLLLRFARDRRGAFAMQLALMIIPLMACTGLAIDGGRAFLARFELMSALDAAALAVGSTVNPNKDELEVIAQRYVDTNFRQAPAGSVVLTLSPTDETVELRGAVQIETYFMPIIGIPYVDISAVSEVRRGGANVEVALVLDTTGSMAGQRMTDLKAAAKDLVDIVVSNDQSTWYSKLAIVSYGDNVYAGGYADVVRGAPAGGAAISDAGWRDGNSKSVSDADWKDGGTKNISGVSKSSRAVVTASSHGFSNGDYVYITSIKGMTQLNGNIYLVSGATSSTIELKDPSSGNYINSSSFGKYKSKGTLQKCFSQTCEVKVSATNHGFANGDFVHIDGVSGMSQINNAADETWVVKSRAANSFLLTGSNGPSYSTYKNSGSATHCYTEACEVRVTAAGHGLSNDDRVYITGVKGMAINTSGDNSWVISGATTNSFVLKGTEGPDYSNYTGSGAVWCLKDGCQYYRFTTASGSTTIRQISNCTSERIGSEAYTDAPPSTATIGRVYAGSGYSGCRSSGALELLSADKTSLKNAISNLDTNDSTAGHIGLGWGWYMISPKWADLWPSEINRPHAYGEKNLAKVLVLMTDGDFNTAYCNSVVAKNHGVGSNSERINCNATNGDPFTQADNLCANIKASGITIYTVGFGNGLSNGGGDFLRDCASDESRAYLAATGAELKTAFKSIAKSITQLRISL